MAYLSLYRKWRPQTFDDVVGQRHVVRTLVNALNEGRTAHAYLFCGPRGTGKTTVARLLAKGLNCEQGPTGRVCNACESCRRIAEGSALDVIEIDGASNRGIDEVREIRDRVHYAPTHGRYKVYIVDEVHMLTNEAFNALLKILEEPPAHVVFIFATTEAHKIPATIASRCQRFDFHRFRPAELIEQLRKVLKGEGVPYEEEALALLARHAEGGMRDALAVLDQCIAYDPAGITVQTVNEVLGTAPRDRLVQFVRLHMEGELGQALALVRELDESSVDLRQFARDVIGYLRDLMVLRAAGPAAEHLVTLLDAERAEAAELARQFTLDQILGALEVMGQVEATMRWAPSPALALELASVRLAELLKKAPPAEAPSAAATVTSAVPHTQAAAAPAPSGTAAQQTVDSAAARERQDVPAGRTGSAGRTAAAEAPAAGAQPRQPASSADSRAASTGGPDSGKPRDAAADPSGELQTLWERLLHTLKKERLFQCEALLREGTPVRLEKNALVVRFPTNREFHYAAVSQPEHRQTVERVLGRLVGRSVRLELYLGDAPPEPVESRAGSPPSNPKPGAVDPEDEPLLRAALRLFGGMVTEVRREEENTP